MIWRVAQPTTLCPPCISNPSVIHTHTHTHTHTSGLLVSLQRSPLHTHPHTPQCVSVLAHRLTSRFITHQISFRFAMKNQIIKNALNMRVVCLCGDGGSWGILHLDCLILCPTFTFSSPLLSFLRSSRITPHTALMSFFASESVCVQTQKCMRGNRLIQSGGYFVQFFHQYSFDANVSRKSSDSHKLYFRQVLKCTVCLSYTTNNKLRILPLT